MPSRSTKYNNASNSRSRQQSVQSPRAACQPLAMCTIYKFLQGSNFIRFKDLLGHNEKYSRFLVVYSLSHFTRTFSRRGTSVLFLLRITARAAVKQ